MSETAPAPDPITSIYPSEIYELGNDARFTYNRPDRNGDPGRLDPASNRTAANYLYSRHIDDPDRVRRHLIIAATPLPLPKYVPGGSEVTRYTSRRAEGYWINKKFAALVMAVSAVVINGPPAVTAATHYIEQVLYRPTPPRDELVTTPGKTITIPEQVASKDKSGSFAVNTVAVESFVGRVLSAEVAGDSVEKIELEARTSDEFANYSSIGKVSVGNTVLDKERDSAVLQVLEEDFGNNLPASASETGKEHVISKAIKASLNTLAQKFGFANLYTAIEAVDSGQHVNAELESQIHSNFNVWRGVDVVAVIKKHGHLIRSLLYIKGKDNPPPGPHGWLVWFVPMIPVRRRELVSETVEKGKWTLIPKLLPWPNIVQEDKDNVWLRFLKEVKNEDGTLKRFPWAYTRKYLHLFRDKRIPLIMRADYQGEDGTDKSFYTLFVDHTPTAEVLDVFESQMSRIASVQGGRLGDLLTLAVHPSSQAGRSPDRPWRIGPGFDKQYGESTLGACAPLPGMVEMHMETDDMEELAAAIKNFGSSPFVTMDHEVPGHGSSIIRGPLKIVRAFSLRYRNAHVPERDHFDHELAAISARQADLADPRDPVKLAKQLDSLQFDVKHRGEDGELVGSRIGARDELLGRSEEITIVGTKATRYSSASDLENKAETAAAGMSGSNIPFTETGTDPPVPEDEPERYRRGYRPAREALDNVTENLGGVANTYPIEFEHVPEVRISIMYPEEDPEMAKLVALARNHRFPKSWRMLAVLAKTASHDQQN